MVTHTSSIAGSGHQRIFTAPVIGALVAFLVTAVLAVIWLGVTVEEFRDLILYLVASSLASGLLGYGVYRWTESGRRSIRMKILTAYAIGVSIVIVNILVTAQLMFLSPHDLGLLMVLLVFGSVFSVSFGTSVAGRITHMVHQLSESARRVSGGDRDARVEVATNDELADLARSFNDMVANVNEAEAMRRRAEEARRDLVAAVSHDLRTPLTALQAMLEALDDGLIDDPTTVHRYHQTMRAQVSHLSRLIDDLFELSQLDAEPQPYELSRTDIGSVIRTAIEGLAMSAQGQAVSVELDAAGPIHAWAEPTKITRVVTNLVDNAVQHSPAGSTVRVSVCREGNDVAVRVVDQGPGVHPEDVERVFDRFYRGEKSRSREHGGTGLGLAIARGIVEAHRGRIWAENDDSRGARFCFVLPAVD